MKVWLNGLLGLALTLAACGGDASVTTAGASTISTTATTADEVGDETTTTSTTSTTTTTTAAAVTITTSATTITTATTTAPATTAPATTAPAITTTTAATTTSAPGGGSTVTISAENFGFSPSAITISVGDTVQWVLNEGSHTTTSGAAPTPDGLWNQVITAEGPVSVTFDQAGQFRYYCRFHTDSMQGTVVVEP